jgi:hypothetical protein
MHMFSSAERRKLLGVDGQTLTSYGSERVEDYLQAAALARGAARIDKKRMMCRPFVTTWPRRSQQIDKVAEGFAATESALITDGKSERARARVAGVTGKGGGEYFALVRPMTFSPRHSFLFVITHMCNSVVVKGSAVDSGRCDATYAGAITTALDGIRSETDGASGVSDHTIVLAGETAEARSLRAGLRKGDFSDVGGETSVFVDKTGPIDAREIELMGVSRSCLQYLGTEESSLVHLPSAYESAVAVNTTVAIIDAGLNAFMLARDVQAGILDIRSSHMLVGVNPFKKAMILGDGRRSMFFEDATDDCQVLLQLETEFERDHERVMRDALADQLNLAADHMSSHGTMVRMIAARSTPAIKDTLDVAYAKYLGGRDPGQKTILDAEIGGPKQRYAFGRSVVEVWEREWMPDKYSPARVKPKTLGYRKHLAWASPAARAIFMVKSCGQGDPVVLSNSWGERLLEQALILEHLAYEATPRELVSDAYITDALRAVAMSGRRGLGCANIFAAPNEGSQQILSTGPQLLAAGNVIVATAYIAQQDGLRFSAVQRDAIPYENAAGPRGSAAQRMMINLPSYGPNVALSAPVGYCYPDMRTPSGRGVNVLSASGNSAAAPLIAAATARISGILPDLPWNGVLDVLIRTADPSRFVLPGVYDGVGTPAASAVMLPRTQMGCACETRAVDWLACDVEERRCPRLPLQHSVFSGFGAVSVPAAVAKAERLSRLMRSNSAVARAVRAHYLRRSEHHVPLRRSRDAIDLEACTPEVRELSPVGHDQSIAYIIDDTADVRSALRLAAGADVILEQVEVRGMQMHVSAVRGVSMWLERTRGKERATVYGSGSIMQAPDVRKRKRPAGVVFARTMSIRYWNELLLGGADGGGSEQQHAGWRVCITGLSRRDVAKLEVRRKNMPHLPGDANAALVFHGRFLGGGFTRDIEGDVADSARCACAVPRGEGPAPEEDVWPSLSKVRETFNGDSADDATDASVEVIKEADVAPSISNSE